MEANNKILIIGPPNSGKTTFLAQFNMRLESSMGELKLSKAAENTSAIENACDRLANGEETEATPATENSITKIPLLLDSDEWLLEYHDYGGEQVHKLTKLLQYDKTWIERAKKHDRWILFIRPSQIHHCYDLSMKGFAAVENEKRKEIQNIPSDQYHFIELLQVLLHARGLGTKSRIDTPRLLIVLTCWDELNTDKKPKEVLKEYMPLFYEFMASNWKEQKFKAVGVSAQGFSLSVQENKEKYQNQGPEHFGYLVTESNPEEKDLTKLIKEAIEL